LLDLDQKRIYYIIIKRKRRCFMARIRRSVDERVAELDAKIEKKQAELKALEAQKTRLLNPISMKTVMTKAKEAGLSAEDVAKKLGLDV